MRHAFAALLLTFAGAVAAIEPPPPAPAEARFYDDIFTALPGSFPADDLSTLKPLVVSDLEVIENGELRFTTRDDWLAWLQTMAAGHNVERVSMSREEFFIQPENRILVREFWFPIKKDTEFHPDFPHKLVSYKFEERKLVRVEYVTEMRPMRPKPGSGD